MRVLQPSTLRIGYRYRPSRLKGPYDALIIGSGIGGLTTASLLSDLGWKVAVLEQHYTAGGNTHSYERAGYDWSLALSRREPAYLRTAYAQIAGYSMMGLSFLLMSIRESGPSRSLAPFALYAVPLIVPSVLRCIRSTRM